MPNPADDHQRYLSYVFHQLYPGHENEVSISDDQITVDIDGTSLEWTMTIGSDDDAFTFVHSPTAAILTIPFYDPEDPCKGLPPLVGDDC